MEAQEPQPAASVRVRMKSFRKMIQATTDCPKSCVAYGRLLASVATRKLLSIVLQVILEKFPTHIGYPSNGARVHRPDGSVKQIRRNVETDPYCGDNGVIGWFCRFRSISANDDANRKPPSKLSGSSASIVVRRPILKCTSYLQHHCSVISGYVKNIPSLHIARRIGRSICIGGSAPRLDAHSMDDSSLQAF